VTGPAAAATGDGKERASHRKTSGSTGLVSFLQALSDWLSAAGLKRIQLQSIDRAPTLQERLPAGAGVGTEIRQAEAMRDRYGMPFWEALLLTLSDTGKLGDEILRGAGYQHKNDAASWHVEVAELADSADRLWQADCQGNAIAVLSDLGCGDRRRHLAMIDFRLQANAANTDLACEISRHLGGGLLVNSGKSFHLYGSRLLGQDEFHAFLGLAAQYNPLVDGRWAAHQHRAGRAALRISPRAGVSPRILEIVEVE
jgi:hypothetical protein